MTHVVTSTCVDHKYQECVAVCPVEAFREAETYLVIDPDECIDCGACIPECPVDAILGLIATLTKLLMLKLQKAIHRFLQATEFALQTHGLNQCS